MQTQRYVISSKEYLDSIVRQLRLAIDDHGFVTLEVKAGSNRSINQLGLWWMWMTELAAHFTKKGVEVSKDDMYDMLCNKFLGTETKIVGSTEIIKLRGVSKLTKGEMHELMEKVHHWGIDHGVAMTNPADSEYQKLIERQNG